ncbi:hypothetical protein P886_1481 [Alteromonadaceae bacterium 2753L.S.0a.02]|nr:hypothetical protein P886_1481 [Alteromonadaceae bacterium 2753L.S.0a.02]
MDIIELNQGIYGLYFEDGIYYLRVICGGGFAEYHIVIKLSDEEVSSYKSGYMDLLSLANEIKRKPTLFEDRSIHLSEFYRIMNASKN